MADSNELVIARDVPVPMRDGVELRADVYYPGPGRWPVLVQRTPYGKTRWIGSFVGLNPVELAARGYAVVVQDVRGRGDSPGEHYPFDEADDGYDTIAWAAEQPWSNGRVGGYGSSYMAASQMQEAVAAPPALAVICPVQAPDDYFEGRSYWGGAFEFGSMVSVALGAQAGGTLDRLPAQDAARLLPLIGPTLDTLASSTPTFPLGAWLGDGIEALRELTPWFFDWLAHPDDDAFWRRINVSSRHSSVTVPALHITGWYDSFCAGAIRNYTGLRSNAATEAAREGQHLVVGPWAHYSQAGIHSARVSGGYFGAGAALNLLAEQMNWLDEHLQPGATPSTERPRVRYFVMGENQWRSATDWPPPGTRPLELVLTRDGGLAEESEGEQSMSAFDYNPGDPVPTLGGAHLIGAPNPPGPADQTPVEARPDVLSYTSDVLPADLRVVGWVRVRLRVTSSAPCTDFTAKLVDVHADGTPMSVCDGIRRASLPSDEPTTVVIELGATAMNFRAGHRVRLDVSSSNFPRFDPNPNTGRAAFDEVAPVIAHQRIVHGGSDSPSSLMLPVLDGKDAD
jgi:putative CocE/NonD family hydrolase